MVDLITYAGNNKKNNSYGTAGKIAYTLPGNMGTIASGEDYKVASVPANCLITGVHLIVSTAFNGTTPTGDVTVGSNVRINDQALTAGVTSYTTAEVVTAKTDILFTPTLTGATAGEATIVVEFVELDGYEGTFTE